MTESEIIGLLRQNSDLGFTQDEIAEKVGCSKRTVRKTLRNEYIDSLTEYGSQKKRYYWNK